MCVCVCVENEGVRFYLQKEIPADEKIRKEKISSIKKYSNSNLLSFIKYI